ncbi:hypothetical protein [Microbulbifer sp. THAF38]|uniref:hypothetical protein n=1 Tax=Microbulbifer sp. THAF38 TaxID=2587856 RepID=UPI001267C026|nr:hypothetical protein [Microbulbifer sp. THAF38]QFT55451.1 hypothetical protein FIU95_12895 [Microbulbifer sp. THAF38]
MRSFIALCVAVALASCSKTPEELAQEACIDSRYAIQVSQKFVKRYAPLPHIAKLIAVSGEEDSKSTYRGDCIHNVEGWVEFDNGFGDIKRRTFTIKVEYIMNEDHWAMHEIIL